MNTSVVNGSAVAPGGPAEVAAEVVRSAAGHVRVPMRFAYIAAVNPTAYLVLAIIYRHASSRTGSVRLRQADVMRALGRSGRDATVVRRAVAFLERAGVVAKERQGIGRYRYQLLVRPGGRERWDEIARTLLNAIADGQIGPAVMPVWVASRRALGDHLRTRWTNEQIASEYADLPLSARTVAHWLSHLRRLGLLSSWRCGDGHRMLCLPDLIAPTPAPQAGTTTTHPRDAGSAALAVQDPPPLWGADLAFEKDLAIEQASTSALADDRPVPIAHESDGATAQTTNDRPEPTTTTTTTREPAKPHTPRSMPKRARRFWGGGASDDPVVARVLGGLPEQWRTGWHRPYTRPIAVAIREAITDRPEDPEHLALTPDAARYAMRHLTDPERHRDRSVPAAKEALRLLASLTRAGLACRDCGHDDRPMDHGLCIECTPLDTTHDPASLALIPVEERRAVYASLGLDPDDAGPPEAPESHVSAYQPQTGTDPHLSAESASEATTDALAGIAACRAALTSARTGRS